MKSRKTKIKEAVIEKIKSLIAPVIILLIILAGIFVVITFKNVEEEEHIVKTYAWDGETSEVVLENDSLKLVMDPKTTQFGIEVKKTGKVWYSNPQDLDTNETIALGNELNKLKSTLLLSYSTNQGLENLYNSYDYSIGHQIYEIEQGDDYIKVNYSLGNVEKEFMIPPVCIESEFDSLTANMTKDYANMTKQYYKKYDINKLGKKDNKDELLEKYPILETEVIYVLRDTTKDGMKTALQGYFESAGYTFEMYQADKELDNSTKSSDKPIYDVSVIYKLDGDDLLVEIPLNEIDFREDYPIYTITPLPYFGAGSTADEGFVFVPEGGGAIMNFNNGKTAQSSYYANMYGWDMGLIRKAVVHNTRAYFNTFGVSDNENSFLCIMEDGESYGSVQADVSGKFNSYNFVNAVYSMMLREQYDVGDLASSSVFIFIPELPDETIVQRYSFINSGSYVDMAKDYRAYLESNYGDYLTMNDDTATPAVIEVVGAVDKVEQVCGFPVKRPLKLTTYDEASKIVNELLNDGITNMSVKMTGWANGGENQKILKSVKTINSLGSKSDLKKMVANAKSQNVDVYLDGVTQYAYDSDLLDGFNSFRDSARFISKERAKIYQYSQVTYGQREGTETFYLLHTKTASKMMDNLVKAADKYGAGISFRDTGLDLSADYDRKNIQSRDTVEGIQQEKLKALADAGKNVCINMGNVYAAVYSDTITNMDLKGSEYTILDTYVPFYEIALHGYVNYTGDPVNLSGDATEAVLTSAEYGAGLSFSVMKETAFALQKTLYTEYYGSAYDSCHDDLVNIYTRYNNEMGHIFNQAMTNHEQLTPEVSCTTYEDGTKVYVNYSYTDYSDAGVSVPARDYKVIK